MCIRDSGVRRAGGGAERSGPPPACGAGKLLRLRRSAADGHLSALAGPLLPGGEQLRAALPPVSYTHLDVYKRQASGSVSLGQHWTADCTEDGTIVVQETQTAGVG